MEHDIALSVLVCRLQGREKLFERLCCNLPHYPEVELLHYVDAGELSIGAKRNRLLAEAAGKYVAFIDDDDEVVENYLPDVLDALKPCPDVVGIEGVLRTKDRGNYVFKHSIRYCTWYRGEDGVFYRTPNHLNPVRRELARMVGFPEIDFGEDQRYSQALLPFLKTEIIIKKPVYFYNSRL